MLQIKTHIATHQLAWIITECVGEKEIITLANQCGILHEGQQRSTLSKDWLANDLATCFFYGALTEKTVSQCLGKKAEQVTRRVQYMSVEEIRGFLRSVEQLREDGEFGEILWALLADSREEVQQHGYKLLADHEQYLPPPVLLPDSRDDTSSLDDVQGAEPLEVDTATSTASLHHASDQEPLPESMAPLTREHALIQVTLNPATSSDPDREPHLRDKLNQRKQEIDELQATISAFRSEHTILQNENEKLKQKIEALTEENRILKGTEVLDKESELHIDQLKSENKNLKQDLEKFSDQLCKFHELQLQKEKISAELKSVEEVAYHSQQVLERMKSDFHSQFSYLQEVNEEYKTVLTRARQRVTNLIGQRNTGSGGKNRILSGQARVGVFVDVQNMFYAAKDRYARRLDYIKLLDLIVGPRNLVIAYAYVVQIPEINQAGFLSLLEHNGYTIKSKDLRMRGDGSAKGDWDVGIAIDIVSMLEALDVVILASGDGDFCALAEMIKQHGRRIEVVAFEHNTSMDLQRVADQFFPIGDEMLI